MEARLRLLGGGGGVVWWWSEGWGGAGPAQDSISRADPPRLVCGCVSLVPDGSQTSQKPVLFWFQRLEDKHGVFVLCEYGRCDNVINPSASTTKPCCCHRVVVVVGDKLQVSEV